jgi:6-phosphogluconolactonase (cycloisomerase 2 family)
LDTLSAFVENPTSHYSPAPGSPYSLGSNTGSLEGIATTPDGNFVYVVSLGGAVSGFSVASNGSLTVVPGSPFPVANNSMDAVTDAAGKFLFVVNSSSVSVFTIDSASGSLSATGAPVALPASSLPTPGMAATTPSPANYLYVALTSANAVAAFSFDATTGALTPVSGSPFPVGLGPLTLTTTAKAVYVSNPLDGTISALAWDKTTGALTPISGSPFNAQAGSGAMAALYDQYLYLPSTNSIVAFSIDGSGALTPLSGSPFAAGVHLWGGLTAF